MQDVLLHVVNCWCRAIDDGKFVLTGFLDLAKVLNFGRVNHDILLTKLKQYGKVHGQCLFVV